MVSQDQLGRNVQVNKRPRRIISLVPSQTELLYALGLEKEVLGITKFCIYPPEWHTNKQRIGGTKNINIDLIRKLKPDLIIGNKEENTKEDIELLEKEFPVWLSDIDTFEQALWMIDQLGKMTHRQGQATKMVDEINQRFSSITRGSLSPKVLYFIWNNPDFVVGKDTFIHAMIDKIGWSNVVQDSRYPECTDELIENADFLLLSSEPFPFKEAHRKEFMEKYPNKKVILVDGEMFSWYGSRMLLATQYFKDLQAQLSH